MLKKIMTVAAAALLASTPAIARFDQMPHAIEWQVGPGKGAKTGEPGLTIMTRGKEGGNGLSTNAFNLSDAQGFDAAALASPGTSVSFRLTREAGSLACQGIAGRQRGTGDCRFEPNRRFAQALARRGIGSPTDGQLFYLAVNNVGLDLAEELDRSGYPRPTLDKFVEAGIFGVRADYVREMRALGHRPETLASLVQMRIHGVTPAYVRELAAAGFKPDSKALSTLALHGVSPAYIHEMRRLEPSLTLDKIARLRIHGVTTAYVDEMRRLGYPAEGLDELAQMRILGVTPDFVRQANAQAGARLEPRQLIHRKVMGSR